MTLGSWVKGPNNVICREWARKAGPWSHVSSLIMVFMEAFTWEDFGLTS